MATVCWSAKGGSGTSVVAALYAVARAQAADTVLIDADGDQAAIFGLDEPTHGMRQWLDAGPRVPDQALSKLTVEVRDNLRLLPPGSATRRRKVPAPAARRLLAAFEPAEVVVDAGCVRNDDEDNFALINSASVSVAVLRPCYLAARRTSATGFPIDGIVLMEEPGRALGGRDLEDVLGAPVIATLTLDAAIARAVDAGRLGKRLPRSAKPLREMLDGIELRSEMKHVG